MSEISDSPSPEKEAREKLKQLRANFKSVQRLVEDIENTYEKFAVLRTALSDKDNGAKRNLEWVAEQKKQINKLLKEAGDSFDKLKRIATSIDLQIADMNSKYARFQETSLQVFDEQNGFEALLGNAKALHDTISKYVVRAKQRLDKADENLGKITKSADDVDAAFTRFKETVTKLEDPENGLAAQLRKATEYATSVLDAKTKVESEHLAIKALQADSETIVVAMNESKTAVEELQKDSRVLTDDIRNTLNMASSFSLSSALKDRSDALKWQLIIWGGLSLVAIVILIAGVVGIFYSLFLHGAMTPDQISARLKDGPTLASVISKFLFTTPLVFAVYFTTSNFRHVRDLRDKYAWKETVAKNVQNYVKTLKEEFSDKAYEHARFSFVIKAVQGIYTEPTPTAKRKKYYIGFKVFNLALEEEDLLDLAKVIKDGVEEIAINKATDQPGTDRATDPDALEDVIESAADNAVEPPAAPV